MSFKSNQSLNYLEFKSTLGVAKRASDPVVCRFFFRPISNPLGWVLYKAGLRANDVSLASVFVASISSALIAFGGPEIILSATLLMATVAILDCVDGNIARARGEAGVGGEWMDALSGYTTYALLPLALGIHLSINSPIVNIPWLWILLGSLMSVSNLYMRLLYQKYINAFPPTLNKRVAGTPKAFFANFSGEAGLVGWMMPTLIIAALVNELEVYLTVYSAFYVISAVAITLYLIGRIFKDSKTIS